MKTWKVEIENYLNKKGANTKQFFKRFPTPLTLEIASIDEIAEIVGLPEVSPKKLKVITEACLISKK